jgi:branched-chain amino acid transport system substrate-binding protein
VHALGLEAAKGLQLTASFYWDMNDKTRAFSDKFAARFNGRRPTMLQAGVYSSLVHYMKGVKALGSTDGEAVVAKMKEMPTDDPLFGQGKIRPDGRKIHNMYLFEVKSPAESKAPWDYYKLVETIQGDEAFRPMADGNCPLVKG